ncbi:MAG TPA: BON domain-containing protein [Bryobacteraceae bacterium]
MFKILLGALFLAVLAQGQSKAPAVAPRQPSARGKSKSSGAKGTTSAQDREIEAAIKAKLAKSKIKKDGFTVRVQGGVAYWEGTTSVIQHKGSATRMAKSAGAKAVVNNIKITDAAKQKATQNLDQGRRRAQIKRSEPRAER